MKKNLYIAPVIWQSTSEDNPTVIGEGSSQGSLVAPDGMTYDEWWEVIACFGENPDANYNGDEQVDRADWEYYCNPANWHDGIFDPQP